MSNLLRFVTMFGNESDMYRVVLLTQASRSTSIRHFCSEVWLFTYLNHTLSFVFKKTSIVIFTYHSTIPNSSGSELGFIFIILGDHQPPLYYERVTTRSRLRATSLADSSHVVSWRPVVLPSNFDTSGLFLSLWMNKK